ncbi:unnamed protein product [Orchesella dallaii]|uniref:Uncharacterized protein n=1 Tax=Orchesella dallaii TaxID=48710 RepID=A0ABP1QF53_9HEXA
MNKVILLAAIFIALVCFVSTTPVLWTWSNLREKEIELEGRTGIKVAESSKYCQDARQCRSSQFHYDFYSLHCYKTSNLATREISAVKYKNYNPMSPTVSTCVNLGGEAVTGSFGYMFQKDEVSAADYFNIDTEEDYTFSVGETLSTNEPITNAGRSLKVYQSGSLLGQGLHYVSFPGSEYYLFQMFFALIDNEDSGSMYDINLTGRDGTVLSLRWGDGERRLT